MFARSEVWGLCRPFHGLIPSLLHASFHLFAGVLEVIILLN